MGMKDNQEILLLRVHILDTWLSQFWCWVLA